VPEAFSLFALLGLGCLACAIDLCIIHVRSSDKALPEICLIEIHHDFKNAKGEDASRTLAFIEFSFVASKGAHMKTPFRNAKKWIGLLVRILNEILKLALLVLEFLKKIREF